MTATINPEASEVFANWMNEQLRAAEAELARLPNAIFVEEVASLEFVPHLNVRNHSSLIAARVPVLHNLQPPEPWRDLSYEKRYSNTKLRRSIRVSCRFRP